jgi:hypothetical protein
LQIGEEIRELRKLQPTGAEGVVENPELLAKEKVLRKMSVAEIIMSDGAECMHSSEDYYIPRLNKTML